MRTLSMASAACLAAGALALGAGPAQATLPSDPCAADPGVHACVHDGADRAIAALELARTTYDNTLTPGETPQETACRVYEITTGEPCPIVQAPVGDPCLRRPSEWTCVNEGFDVLIEAIETVRDLT